MSLKHMRRPSSSFILSLSLHAVLGVFVMRAVLGSATWLSFGASRDDKPAEETIRYARLPGRIAPTPVEGREGGDGLPVREKPTPPAPMPRAPLEVPSIVPAPSNPSVVPPSGNGPLVGRGGPLRGIEPAYNDGRVWSDLVPAPPVKLSARERIDSVIADRFSDYRDSVRLAEGDASKDPSDWTVTKGGYKWGLDPRFIRLGPISIPTPLLALLPLNKAAMQGNVLAAQRSKQQNAWSREIQEQAQRSLNEDEFRVAVKRLRERKEKERAARRAESVVAGEGKQGS